MFGWPSVRDFSNIHEIKFNRDRAMYTICMYPHDFLLFFYLRLAHLFLGFRAHCSDAGPADQLRRPIGNQEVHGLKLRDRLAGRIRRASVLRQLLECHR